MPDVVIALDAVISLSKIKISKAIHNPVADAAPL